MSKTRVTLFPNGVSNASPNTFEGLANLRIGDPTKYHVMFDDFNEFDSTFNWDATLTTGTAALASTDGGEVLLSTAATDNTFVSIQKFAVGFAYESDKELWFKTKIQVNDVTESDVLAGLTAINADPIAAVVDGIYFLKSDDAATIDFVLTKDSTSTTLSEIATLTDATDVELAFHYDGIGTFSVFVDDALAGTQTTLDNVPDDVVIAPIMTVQAGAAAITTMNLDYVLAVKER